MKNEVSQKYQLNRLYLRQFQFFDGECDITFNIVDINTEKMIIHIAVTNRGRISVIEYDLLRDRNDNLYFEYGIDRNKIDIDDFEKIY